MTGVVNGNGNMMVGFMEKILQDDINNLADNESSASAETEDKDEYEKTQDQQHQKWIQKKNNRK